MTLEAVMEAVREYIDVADDEASFVHAALAVAVSKALTDEEPLWAMLVGAPSSGKSEAIRLLDELADLRVDELTRAGLLSWGTGGKKAKRTGILTRVPPHALLTVSDFSTVVTASDREGRARMYGMLRVVYDGHVYRGIGGEPAGDGDQLEWSGHLTMVAAATPTIDNASSFEGALGEPQREPALAESDAARAVARARYVVDRNYLAAHRAEAQHATRELFIHARARIPQDLPDALIDRLVNLATFVAHARTGVQHEGTGRARVILGVPTPEEPMRLVGQLTRFARCAVALGLDHGQALKLATRIGLDSVPLARMRVLRAIVESGDMGCTVADAHRALVRGNRWAAIWELDALEAIGLVTVEGPSRDEEPAAHRVYKLAAAYEEVCENVGRPLIFSLEREEESGFHGEATYTFAHPERRSGSGIA